MWERTSSAPPAPESWDDDRWPGRRRGLNRWARGPRIDGPLRRRRENGLAGGVAAGLAARTGLDVTLVRAAFVVTAVFSGFGAAAYMVAWLLIPAAGQDTSIGAKAFTDRRGLTLTAGVCSLIIVLLLIASAVGAPWLSTVSWPLVITAGALVLVWRNAPAEEQAVLQRLADPLLGIAAGSSRRRIVIRVVIAALLLVVGLSILLSGRHDFAAVRQLGGLGLVVAAILVVLGPWWLRIARDLVVERQARVRAEERADIAARVHDSVLQTLALIQRRASDPQQVVQLARAQERELRSWLFDGQAPGSLAGPGMTLAAGIRLIQQEVEAQHGVPVEAITVGDCDLDEDLSALLAAAREATVNAAKWSGAAVVSLFAEAEPTEVAVYVRDRGKGFDPATVPSDRKGLTESIQARMARRGGTAVVRSAPGEGTEVTLRMPRDTAERQPSRT
jgi:signal transduction histidine kinase/phage shock protein PspC (stress-responsive transcriptional regulator)